MIQALGWFAVIILWIFAGAFAVSDILCLLALVHRDKNDRYWTIAWAVVVLVFAMLGAGFVYAALAVGRCL